METRILLGGIMGKTGREIFKVSNGMDDVKIVAGLTRRDLPISGQDSLEGDAVLYNYRDLERYCFEKLFELDAVVEFSDSAVFEQTCELAVRTAVPLISGTANLSNRQMAMLMDATNRIPVFRGGNFMLRVHEFINDVVGLMRGNDNSVLVERLYDGMSKPSETAKVIQYKVFEETGKRLEISSMICYSDTELIREWSIGNGLKHCRVVGMTELATDVLRIARAMVGKPVKRGEFYTLDDLYDEIKATL